MAVVVWAGVAGAGVTVSRSRQWRWHHVDVIDRAGPHKMTTEIQCHGPTTRRHKRGEKRRRENTYRWGSTPLGSSLAWRLAIWCKSVRGWNALGLLCSSCANFVRSYSCRNLARTMPRLGADVCRWRHTGLRARVGGLCHQIEQARVRAINRGGRDRHLDGVRTERKNEERQEDVCFKNLASKSKPERTDLRVR